MKANDQHGDGNRRHIAASLQRTSHRTLDFELRLKKHNVGRETCTTAVDEAGRVNVMFAGLTQYQALRLVLLARQALPIWQQAELRWPDDPNRQDELLEKMEKLRLSTTVEAAP